MREQHNCWLSEDPGFVDIGKHDCRLRKAVECAVDRAGYPGRANGMDLRPRYQYVHPCSGAPRPAGGKLDIGAYEYQSGDAREVSE
ncbi:MAG: hypothetical protein ACOC8E_07330 [Planctomycetota bacterium]